MEAKERYYIKVWLIKNISIRELLRKSPPKACPPAFDKVGPCGKSLVDAYASPCGLRLCPGRASGAQSP
jgi:hypothetical protein